ncbi:MAG: aminotransferase class V-fold PLP-dependent enzyme [Chlamydiota bacterium]
MLQIYLNASSFPSFPREVNTSLQAIYALLGASKEDCFYFTRGSHSSLNQIFFSHHLNVVRETGKNHVLTLESSETHTEHVLKQIELLGWGAKKLPLNEQGQLAKQVLIEAVRPRTSLLSLSWVNGLTGVIQPVHEIADVCKQNGIRLHLDATFALGALFFRLSDLDIDFLSFDGAFLKAPVGTGGFFAKSSLLIERNEEPNHIELAALVKSLDALMCNFDYLSTETARLRDKLEKGIQEGIKETHVFFQNVERLPNSCVIAFPGIASDTLHYLLQKRGIHASQGGGYFPSLSSILISYGIDPFLAQTALQFSLSYDTTESQIDFAIQEIVDLVKKIRPWSKELVL